MRRPSFIDASGHWLQVGQMLAFMAMDVLVVWVSTLLAYWARFGGLISPDFVGNAAPVAIVASVVFVTLFWVFRLYHQVWRHMGADVFVKTAVAVGIGVALLIGANLFVSQPGSARFAPIGILLLTGTFVFIGATTIRAFGRLIAYVQSEGGPARRGVLVIGAGDAGVLLLRDIENQPELGMRVVGFLDDDPAKQGRFVRGKPVLGPILALPDIIEGTPVEEVLIAIPSADTDRRREILNACASVGLKTRIMQSLTADTRFSGVQNLRKVKIEDLLGRKPVDIDVEQIAGTLSDRVVAVTGAAGSIGSELCRQIVKMRPSKLLLIDIDESRLYETFLELRRSDADSPQMEICDVRDEAKVDRLFARERPAIVLHAAAYKHVPLMEMARDEAVKANVLGTRNVIRASEAHGVEHFILISTDKAVAPSSFMGLTKAIAERQLLASCRRGLRASAVRFGNVLGSRGSVVPIFEDQLRRGGPLQVTHPDVTRYFMTIPEAARLVLQAQAISDGGELFVLEMGEPVRIVDLAHKMIALAGIDTHVEFTGLRPAEKLHEILVHAEEDLLDTGCAKIQRVNALPTPPEDFEQRIDHLIRTATAGDGVGILADVTGLMPDYRPFVDADSKGDGNAPA
jgi:FlaA1/EpsC-like NDP-sugar epimerase